VEFIGVNDSFGMSAENYDELLTRFALTSDAVANAVSTLLKGSKECTSASLV
jgi:transketolase C-terminal domain/subunit